MKLVFIHGRAQENKDAVQLKAEWVDALRQGLARSGLQLPLGDADIRFPYYGQALYDLVRGSPDVAEIVVRGAQSDTKRLAFMASVFGEMLKAKGLSVDAVQGAEGEVIVERGPQNWKWVQAILRTLDRDVPGASATSVALVTNDVYEYLRRSGFAATIENGVRQAMTPNTPTVVVSHSLGTVVAYNLLRREGASAGWQVPMLVTLGSPLAITEIKRSLTPIEWPSCVKSWYNARDSQDVVALYPLDTENFPVNGAVDNNSSVKNATSNKHGISGYLGDAAVARRIHQALTQP